MKQNTAMQELIQWMEVHEDDITHDAYLTAKLLLKKEEEQIVEAYNDGEGKVVGNGQKYFTQTYNNQ